MAYQAQALDSTEPVSDSSWEIVANMGLYHVVDGLAITYDSGNMTFDVAAGTVMHNGLLLTIAAETNAETLVSDGTNPRFTWIGVDSTGNIVIVSGTAASTPVVPEHADNTMLALVRIDANETIANDVTKIDKRIPPMSPTGLYQPAHITNNEMYIANGGVFDDASTVWTTTNMGVYTPFSLNRRSTVKKLYHLNGGTIGTDNIDVGIYDADSDGLPSIRRVSSGATALSGATAWQEFDVTDTELAPGLYYLAAVMDGTTDTSISLGTDVLILESRRFSFYQQAIGSGTLPATAAPAIVTATRMFPQLALNRSAT